MDHGGGRVAPREALIQQCQVYWAKFRSWRDSTCRDVYYPVAIGGGYGSKPAHENQDNKDDYDETDDTDAAVTKAVTVPAEATTEATKQENDEDNDEYESKRHKSSPLLESNETM
jgi:hypothetical protein